LTTEDNKRRAGDARKVEIKDQVDPEDIEIIRDEEDDPEWLRKLDPADGPGKADEAEEADLSEEEKPEPKRTGRKKSKKASEPDMAEHLARKNEMLQKLRERLMEAEQTLDIKEDRLVRLAAEFENYKKRTSREWDLLKNQANAGLMTEILGVLDDLDRAFEHSGDSVEHFMDGISLIHTSLVDLLRRNGLKEIESAGKAFDPQYHEAVAEMPSESVEAGHVAEVVQKGYMLNDQVIRPSKVVVSKGNL
jgi:molecular chaperone GrpE